MKQYLFGKGKLHLNLILFSLSLFFFFFVGVASSSCLTPAKVILGLFYILTHDCILFPTEFAHVCMLYALSLCLVTFCVILVVLSFASFVSLCHLLPLNQLPPLPLISLGVCKCLAFTFKYITFIQYNYILSTLCSRCSCGLL